MSVQDFRNRGAAPAAGGRFSGGGARQAAPAAAPARGGGRFAGRQPQPPATNGEPEDDGYEDEPEEQAPPPARGGGANRFAGRGQQQPPAQQPAPAGGRFGRGQPQAAPAGRGAVGGRGRRAAAEPGGRFTGVRSEVEMPPFLEEGEHHVRILDTLEKESQKTSQTYCGVSLEVIESSTVDGAHPEPGKGALRNLMFMTSGKGARSGMQRMMSFVRAAMGYADDESFIADLPNYNQLIGAVCGEPACEQCLDPNGQPFGENPLAGIELYCSASKGSAKTNDDGSTTQYYNYIWEAVPAQG